MKFTRTDSLSVDLTEEDIVRLLTAYLLNSEDKDHWPASSAKGNLYHQEHDGKTEYWVNFEATKSL